MKALDYDLLGILMDLWQPVLEKEGRLPEDDLPRYNFPPLRRPTLGVPRCWRKRLWSHESITE